MSSFTLNIAIGNFTMFKYIKRYTRSLQMERRKEVHQISADGTA